VVDLAFDDAPGDAVGERRSAKPVAGRVRLIVGAVQAYRHVT
jgi:hypothetical protein